MLQSCCLYQALNTPGTSCRSAGTFTPSMRSKAGIGVFFVVCGPPGRAVELMTLQCAMRPGSQVHADSKPLPVRPEGLSRPIQCRRVVCNDTPCTSSAPRVESPALKNARHTLSV